MCYEERAAPKIESPDDVIVKLKAAGLEDSDTCLRRERAGEKSRSPDILGADGAGIVIAVGSKVESFKLGDAVCLYPCLGCGQCELCTTDREFMCAHVSGIGAYATFVRAPARNCFAIPAGLSFEQAAAFPTAYLTAWRMLVTNAELKPGQWVLIADIGSSVTTAALQLAQYLGTRVIVTSHSEENLAKAKEIGAEHGILCANTDFAKEVRRRTGKRGADVVIDSIGGDGWVESLASLRRGGRLVTCGATTGAQPKTNLQRVFWNNLKIFGSIFGSRHEFHQVLNFLKVSRSKPVIDKIMPLTELSKAQQRLKKGNQFGKIVLQMDHQTKTL